MRLISEITRRDILDIIRDGFSVPAYTQIETADFGWIDADDGTKEIKMDYWGRLDEISFLQRLYPLDSMPSNDRRFRTALGDIRQHTVNNDDWDYCWVLSDNRFNLANGNEDEPLLKFICEMLHPAVRDEKAPWKAYLEKFNELLRADGYELYAAQHISGRDIYKARRYTQTETPLLPNNLFSERYKELIQFGNGESVDNISGKVEYAAKKHLCKVMFEFAEPQRIQRNRYDSWTVNTDALSEAIGHLNEFMEFPVIDLFPASFSPSPPEDLLASFFTPFVFDVIEYQYEELSSGEKGAFQSAINAVFQKDNVSFRLSDRGLVELLSDHEVLSPEIMSSLESVSEPGLKDLLNEAIEKHMQPSLQAHHDAVEKIWDALERLKTYYTSLDKKASASKIVNDMANGNMSFIDLFNAEFEALTKIGNNYRIRHHETNKIDIIDPRYYDYFFNRCLSLIALAIQYLH